MIPPLASSDVSYRHVSSDRESIVWRWVIRGDLIAIFETEYPVSHRIPPEYSGRINVVVGMGMGMGCVGLSMVLRSDLIFRWDRTVDDPPRLRLRMRTGTGVGAPIDSAS